MVFHIYVTVVYPRESSDHISDRAPPHLAILAENMLWTVDNLGWLCHVFEEIYQLFNDSWLLDVYLVTSHNISRNFPFFNMISITLLWFNVAMGNHHFW